MTIYNNTVTYLTGGLYYIYDYYISPNRIGHIAHGRWESFKKNGDLDLRVVTKHGRIIGFGITDRS